MKDGEIKYQGSAEEIMTDAILKDIFHIKAQIVTDPIFNRPTLLSYQLL